MFNISGEAFLFRISFPQAYRRVLSCDVPQVFEMLSRMCGLTGDLVCGTNSCLMTLISNILNAG